ncbi:secretory calcium-binding phosphoprotein 1 [Odontesthes bonariensis]|uniref:secretory calcium-binding phosphoprotein 1 n=1 Tax=Odontesthes bonariensis TaxID=219752 RepID=UPI003F587E6A
MKVTIITFCLIGSVFANPIFHNALVSSELDSNSTESLSVSQSSENSTSELQSSEENTSNQSSESESLESTSEDTTSEESNSESDEHNGSDSMAETRDNSMGSEENIRKQSWVRVFASVVKVLSAEDNTSTEVKGHSDYLSNELTINQPSHTSTSTKAVPSHANLPLLNNPTDSSDTASDSADISDSTDATAATSDSSESTSSESQESNSSSESTEASDDSESSELKQVRAKDCVNGTQSCESEEYFLQSIGDDAHFSVDHLMVPDEDDRELRLRR